MPAQDLKLTALLLFLIGLVPVIVTAQDQPATPAKQAPPAARTWHYLLEPYLMLPNMNGTIGIGTLPEAAIDENPGDIFSNVQFGSMIYAEAFNDKWIFSSDLMYMKLSVDLPQSALLTGGNAEAKQLGWELDALRRISPWLAIGIGGQLNSLKTTIEVIENAPSGPVVHSASGSKTWVDPTIAAAIKMPLSKKWSLRARGNIGGFGIGSKIAWQTQVYADYRLSRLFQVSAGYRAIKVDYEKGSGDDHFLYNVITFGPVLRCGFNF